MNGWMHARMHNAKLICPVNFFIVGGIKEAHNTWLVIIKWAMSSEFVSLSIPSWQILTVHAQPFRGARDLAFCLKVSLDSLLVWASSRGSGSAACIGHKYQIRLTRPTWRMKRPAQYASSVRAFRSVSSWFYWALHSNWTDAAAFKIIYLLLCTKITSQT